MKTRIFVNQYNDLNVHQKINIKSNIWLTSVGKIRLMNLIKGMPGYYLDGQFVVTDKKSHE